MISKPTIQHRQHTFAKTTVALTTCSAALMCRKPQPNKELWRIQSAHHRTIRVCSCLDLDIKSILGTNVHSRNMAPSSARLLKSGQPESVLEYNKSMHQYYTAHKMVSRIRRLKRRHKSMTKAQVRKHLNRWDRDQGRAMRASESALRKPPQPYKWSAKLRNAGLLRRYWKFRHSEVQQNLCYSENIARLEAAVRVHNQGFSFPYRDEILTIEEIRKHYNKATKDLTKCQANAEGHRIQSQMGTHCRS